MERTIMAMSKLSKRIRPEVEQKVADLARKSGVDADLLIRALIADFLSRSANEDSDHPAGLTPDSAEPTSP